MLRRLSESITSSDKQMQTSSTIFKTDESENSERRANTRPSRHKSTNLQSLDTLSLAYKNLDDVPNIIHQKYSKKIKTLDLSYNNLSNLSNLNGFDKLETLVLDHNKIDSHVSFPKLPALKMLSVNCNEISNLSIFIKNLASCFIFLKFLSMMKNDAAPSYFNGGSVEQFQDYRYFIISHFPLLEVLDYCAISEAEKKESYAVYGRRWKLKRRKRGSTTIGQ